MRKKLNILIFLTISQLAICQNTILWKVKDTINNRTSFIVGTFHQLGNSFVDSIPEIKKSLYSSEIAIFERLNNNEKLELIRKRKSNNLKKKLGKKTYNKLTELSKDWKFDFNKLKPIELEIKLSQEIYKNICKSVNENDKWEHFDFYLQFLAKEKGIKILGLETFKEQIEFIGKEFNYPKWKSRKKEIISLVDKLENKSYDKARCLLVENYRNFNLDYKLKNNCQSNYLISERNKNWLKVLPNLIKTKNCFIAVGFLHLKNECGLLQKLKKEGFLVEPIKIKPVANKV